VKVSNLYFKRTTRLMTISKVVIDKSNNKSNNTPRNSIAVRTDEKNKQQQALHYRL